MMKVWVYLTLALLCCAVAVFAEHSPSFQLALRDDPETQPEQTTFPEQPVQPDGPEQTEQPTDGPEQPTAGPEQPEQPTASPEQPEQPTASPEKPQNSESSVSSSSDGTMCATVILLCPDNTTATQNDQCEYICGAAPIGGLSWDYVNVMRYEFEAAYGDEIAETSIDTLYGKSVELTPPEQYSDYCIDATVYSPDYVSRFPSVYNGVRVFYTTQVYCSPIRCPDGSLVGCDDTCDWGVERSSSSVMIPISAILFVIVLSSCCCYLRKKKCQAKCNTSSNFQPLAAQVQREALYPSEQYEQLQQEDHEFDPSQVAVPMMVPPQMMFPPHMMMHPQMMYPQMHPQMMHAQMNGQMGMPPMPPQMMMPNGAHPIMMQAPNGMWFPVPPHPEDA